MSVEAVPVVPSLPSLEEDSEEGTGKRVVVLPGPVREKEKCSVVVVRVKGIGECEDRVRVRVRRSSSVDASWRLVSAPPKLLNQSSLGLGPPSPLARTPPSSCKTPPSPLLGSAQAPLATPSKMKTATALTAAVLIVSSETSCSLLLRYAHTACWVGFVDKGFARHSKTVEADNRPNGDEEEKSVRKNRTHGVNKGKEEMHNCRKR